MGNDFLAYMQHFEMLTFFSGYPLIYAVMNYLSGKNHVSSYIGAKIFSLLPFAYALMGTLYLGLQLKNFYTAYSMGVWEQSMLRPYFLTWGILSVLFWIPAFAKRTILSLLHSLVFFFLFVRDIIAGSFAPDTGSNILSNSTNIYTVSLLLTVSSLAFISVVTFVISKFKNR
jgi:hypothetical protein